MFAPALHESEPKSFVWYVGERIGSVSLWARYAEMEFPVYSNTRGQGTWNTAELEKTTQEAYHPSADFYKAVVELVGPGSDPVDVEDCRWWEREALNSLVAMLEQGDDIPEMDQLISHAAVATHDSLTDADTERIARETPPTELPEGCRGKLIDDVTDRVDTAIENGLPKGQAISALCAVVDELEFEVTAE
jgi:hypothetical protein